MGTLKSSTLVLTLVILAPGCRFSPTIGTRAAAPEVVEPEVVRRECTSVLISLEVDGRPELLIALFSDGTLTRSGSGTKAEVDPLDRDVFIGSSGDRLFEKFMATVSDDALRRQGRHDVPPKRGSVSKLSIEFFLGGDATRKAALEYSYGSESEGPPQEVAQLVTNALELTESWYKAQKEMVAGE